MRKGGERRRLSAGSKLMLIMLTAVLAVSIVVLGRLSSGVSIDLNKLKMNLLDLADEPQAGTGESRPAAVQAQVSGSVKPAGAAVPTAAPAPVSDVKGFTMTLGGTISLSGEVRKNCWNADAKACDYSDILMLLDREIQGDIKCVFAENLFCDNYKADDTVAPEAAAGLLKDGGFNLAACGFAQAYVKGTDGIEMTRLALMERGITPAGIRDAEDQNSFSIRSVGGIRAAFIQYTDTMAAKTRKKMEKDGMSGTVPEASAERIGSEIASAREQGAEAVIILMNWGKAGRVPDSAQRKLAEEIAAAGADLIVGCGSHTPQAAEYLAGKDGRQVLCAWSLGSLLSGDRGNAKRESSYLLHIRFESDGLGGVKAGQPEYTPVYTWKYKQDSRYYYRCVVSDGEMPDGMDNDQGKQMAKAAQVVSDVLKDSPLIRRGQGASR